MPNAAGLALEIVGQQKETVSKRGLSWDHGRKGRILTRTRTVRWWSDDGETGTFSLVELTSRVRIGF